MDPEHIWVGDGTRLPISRNLMAALRRLRKEDGSRILWADQVCINQNDIHERNSQVSRMDDVYRGASDVLVWMGDLPLTSDTNIQSDEDLLDSFFEAIEATQPFWWDTRLGHTGVCASIIGTIDLLGFPSRARQTIERDARGSTTARLGEVKNLKDMEDIPHENSIWRRMEGSQLIEPTIMRLSQLHDDFKQRPRTLLELALNSAQTTCSVANDKVFSLRALLSQSQRDLIEVDYGKATATVYTEATYSEFVRSRGLDFLCCVAESKTRTELGLPLWTVDFACNMKEYTSFAYVADFHRMFISLFGLGPGRYLLPERQDCLNAQFQVDLHSEILSFTGVGMDRVRISIPLIDHSDSMAVGQKEENPDIATGSSLAQSLVQSTLPSPMFNPLPKEQFWNPWIESRFSSVKHALRQTQPRQLLANKLSSKDSNELVADVADPLVAAIRTLTDNAGTLYKQTALRVMEAWSRGPGREPVGGSLPRSMRRSENEDFLSHIKYTTGGSDGVLYVTDCGFVGLGRTTIESGDGIIVPICSQYPVVLRLDRETCKHWTVMGLTLVEEIAKYRKQETLQLGRLASYSLK